MATSEGYKCEFVESVFEDFYCKKCTLVARRLTITTCCGESFCQTCIADIQEQGQPCPECGEKEFSTVQQIKNRKRINILEVYCSMKERGCVWSGTLDQLDAHLDPHLDNCQYVDTKCPQNCLQTIPKNKVDHHVAQECTKRPHVCQHCGFKATYEEVVDTHLSECKYVALQCPNMCGVSCEREIIEDHMKICRLEEVACEFGSAGCDGRFVREDQDEHARQNSQKHLILTASLAVETKEQLQQKLLEQDKKHKEIVAEQQKNLAEQEEKLAIQEKKLVVQEKQLLDQKKEINNLSQSLREVISKVSHLSGVTKLNRKVQMERFSQMNWQQKHVWNSPAMYTHVYGCKFCITAAGRLFEHVHFVQIWFVSMPGEYDDDLIWPVRVRFKLELVNHRQGEQNLANSDVYTWNKPVKPYKRIKYAFQLPRSALDQYLANDTLYLHVSAVEML